MRNRGLYIWIAMMLLLLWGGTWATSGLQERVLSKPVDISAFFKDVEEGRIDDVTIDGQKVIGRLTTPIEGDVTMVTSSEGNHDKLRELLLEKKVAFREKPPEGPGMFGTFLSLVPLLFMILIIWFFVRQSGMAAKLGSNRATQPNNLIKNTGVTFNDVQGVDEVVEQCKMMVDFLKRPEKYRRLGARIPSGFLFSGGPGVGKTLLAKAIAGEAGVPFIGMAASEFVEMFVGRGAARVRELWEVARKNAPSIIFIDEFDAVAGARSGVRMGGGNDEREQTLNQILHEMDGFEKNGDVVVIAATNRPEMLDPAAIRTGRFDKKLVVPAPDVRGRAAILAVHAKGKPLAADVRLDDVAKGTPGMAGSDLAGIVNEAALQAAAKDQDSVTQHDLLEAVDTIVAGPERKSALITPEGKKLTSDHECGHVFAAWFDPDADKIRKVTIIPRGMSLGSTWQTPDSDNPLLNVRQLRSRIRTLYGGRCAEHLKYGPEGITAGAGDDLRRATGLAKAMVTELAMVPVADHPDRVYGDKSAGMYGMTQRDYSEATHLKLEEAIHELLRREKAWVTALLAEKQELLDALSAVLCEKETLGHEEIAAVLGPQLSQAKKSAG